MCCIEAREMKIGIFDSGIGGLSLLHEAYHLLPNEEYIFYADTDHVPYGLKSVETIQGYVLNIVKFLIEEGADVVVIACNTATSVGVKLARETYSIPILGMEPAVKPAVEETESKRIMVIATPITVRENKLKCLLKRVDGQHRVDLLAMPELVTFAENEEFESENVKRYLEKQFSSFDTANYSAIVLGCTHFNYFKSLYKNYFGNDLEIIDGNNGTINHLVDIMDLKISDDTDSEIIFSNTDEVRNMCSTKYFLSGRNVTDEATLAHFMRLHNRLEEMRKVR